MKKKRKVGEFMLPDFKTYHKATLIKAMWHWPKDEHTESWNRNFESRNKLLYNTVD